MVSIKFKNLSLIYSSYGIKKIEIDRLLPGDYTRAESLEYLTNLSTEELQNSDKLGKFQVFQTSEGEVLFDGNNRARTLLDRGLTALDVDYIAIADIPAYLYEEVEKVLKRVFEMRDRGINKIEDLALEY
ncbi:hypothetical protein CMI42_00945 [Candidatus Pacearchaeota archaeon]|nr:hypothetical protein [Candidatus Pacearchaeota archaeon]|tara:strand:- start:2311 stop:2700 length:390 start_codon:yes stop_codon:yes gene_type:complete